MALPPHDDDQDADLTLQVSNDEAKIALDFLQSPGTRRRHLIACRCHADCDDIDQKAALRYAKKPLLGKPLDEKHRVIDWFWYKESSSYYVELRKSPLTSGRPDQVDSVTKSNNIMLRFCFDTLSTDQQLVIRYEFGYEPSNLPLGAASFTEVELERIKELMANKSRYRRILQAALDVLRRILGN